MTIVTGYDTSAEKNNEKEYSAIHTMRILPEPVLNWLRLPAIFIFLAELHLLRPSRVPTIKPEIRLVKYSLFESPRRLTTSACENKKEPIDV